MPYWRLFYHLVWATRNREPLIDETLAVAIAASIQATCREPGLRLHAVGLMPNHIHLALSIPPRLAIAPFVGKLIGAASYAANGADHGPQRAHFAWRAEYGILSFGEPSLPTVLAYVRNQPAHHAEYTLWPALERRTDSP